MIRRRNGHCFIRKVPSNGKKDNFPPSVGTGLNHTVIKYKYNIGEWGMEFYTFNDIAAAGLPGVADQTLCLLVGSPTEHHLCRGQTCCRIRVAGAFVQPGPG